MKTIKIIIPDFLTMLCMVFLVSLSHNAVSQQSPGMLICRICPEYDRLITPATVWKIDTGSHVANGCISYRIPVTTGNRYIFKTGCGDGASANYDTYLELNNYQNCSQITYNDDGCELNRSKIEYTADFTGYVYLKVKGFGSVFGFYSLAYKYLPPCIGCPGFDYEIAPVAAWTTHSASITANGCRIYKFSATLGTSYTFKTGCGDGGTSNFDTFLELDNPNCGALAFDDDACEFNRSKIEWVAPYSGNFYLKVRGASGALFGTFTLAYATCITPGHPGTIIGNNNPCFLSSQTYTVLNVPGTTYTWTFPPGWIVTQGGNTNSVTVTVAGEIPGDIQVTPTNGCGSGPTSTGYGVTPKYAPGPAGDITGSTTPCQGTSQVYSVVNVPGVTYTWTFPSGWIQTSGGTTNSVAVMTNGESGNVGVTPSNECGSGTPGTLAVTVAHPPTQSDPIVGNAWPCAVSLQTYSVSFVPGTTYNWSVPCGNITLGYGTNQITAVISSCTVSVTPVNACGNGMTQYLVVTASVPPAANVTVANVTVSSNQIICWGASQVLTVGGTGPFTVDPWGSATLIAGQKISLLPGVKVSENGYLHGYITSGCQYCNGFINAPAGSNITEMKETIHPESIVLKQSFMVYPNPTSGIFTLELTNLETSGELDIEICSIHGEKMMKKKLSGSRSYVLSIAASLPGVYLLRVKSANSVETIKIIKN